MSFSLRACALGSFVFSATLSTAQFVPAPLDLINATGYYNQPVRYKEVPHGICELTPNVKSYAGYVDVGPENHVHWWFFESRTVDPEKADLTVWINGGPGSSSMIGLFQELGPCGIDENLEVVYNPYAWNNVSNVLFIDQPAAVGLSYTYDPIDAYKISNGSYFEADNKTCPVSAVPGSCGTYSFENYNDPPVTNSSINAAPGFWKTLQGFMGVFPQYSRSEFAFATESYGGHYGPIFNKYIQDQNALIANGQLPGAKHINLHTVLIGNGYFEPRIGFAAIYNFSVSPGNTYDYSPFDASLQTQLYNAIWGAGNCTDQLAHCEATGDDVICYNTDEFCGTEVEGLWDVVNRDYYDVRELKPSRFPYEYYKDYLNTLKVQQAIGAFTNYSDHDDAVGSAFAATGDGSRNLSVVEDLRQLVEQGIYVVLYAGDADFICNWLGNEVIAEEVNAPGYSNAGYTNITTRDGIVHGQVKQSGNFAFARIYDSGHEVPFYQPLVALALFERALARKDIATGQSDVAGYLSVGTAKSTYRQGNATVQFEPLPEGATYNITTNAPNPIARNGTETERRSEGFGLSMETSRRRRMRNGEMVKKRVVRRAEEPVALPK